MGQEQISSADRLTNTGRVGSSRKLLQRKAQEKGTAAAVADALEDSFPAVPQPQQDQPQEPHSGTSSAPAATPAQAPATRPTWSSEDEAALQVLLARRKAAGYQRRGRDVSGQVLRPGDVKPNAGTVAATIVGIVAERREVSRAELIEAMAAPEFSHPKAQPQDKGWCQGYVAGAIRSGFLAVVAEPTTTAGDSSTPAAEEG